MYRRGYSSANTSPTTDDVDDGKGIRHSRRADRYHVWRSFVRNVILLLTTFGITSIVLLLLYRFTVSFWPSGSAATDIGNAGKQNTHGRTLKFDACEGIATQKLAVVYAALLAFELGRGLVLPVALSLPDHPQGVDFSSLYDVQALKEALVAVGVEVLDPNAAPSLDNYVVADLLSLKNPVEDLVRVHKATVHLSVGCPMFTVGPQYFQGANLQLFWAVLNGLRPSPTVKGYIDAVATRLPPKHYNLLHFRVEQGWVEHCKQQLPETGARQYCLLETPDPATISLHLAVNVPLYISAHWPDMAQDVSDTFLSQLVAAGYQVHSSRHFSHAHLDKLTQGEVDYEIAMQAARFFGNTVSTFSFLIMIHRRSLGLWSSYYNEGEVPLYAYLPFDHVPWVFVYADGNREWDSLVRGAVRSAVRYNTFVPVCIYFSDAQTNMTNWLADEGVHVLHHKPQYHKRLLEHLMTASDADAPEGGLVTSFQVSAFAARVDIPTIPELTQYKFILSTEPDVFFQKKFTLTTLAGMLPTTVSLIQPDNPDGGAMLLHGHALLGTYEAFITFLLESPPDAFRHQGGAFSAALAYANFYQTSAKKLDSKFGVKPYDEYDANAYVIHYKGPKPSDYLRYYLNMTGENAALCQTAFKKALCPYVRKWKEFLEVSEDEVGTALWYCCTALYAPHLQSLGCTSNS